MPPVRLARHGGAIRLTLSAAVANDLGSLERSLEHLAERLGHPRCFTGCHTLFLQLEHDFTVGEKVELNPQPLPPRGFVELPSDPIPVFQSDAAPAVQVLIPPRVNNNLKSIQKALAITLGKLGCDSCCSGFNILFRRELDLIAFDEKLNATGFGRLG
jgi:hypothetical protein